MADNLLVLDGDGDPRTLRTTDNAGVHTPHQVLDGLPGTAEADIAATAARLTTIVTSLSAISGFVDGLEALATTLNGLTTTLAGYVDGLETALGAGVAQDRTTAASPSSTRLSTGSAFYDAVKTGQLPTNLGTGNSRSTSLSVMIPTDDPTYLAAIEVPASANLAALDAALVCQLYGRCSAGFVLLAGGNFVGTLVAEYVVSPSPGWFATWFYDTSTGAVSSSLALSSSVPAVVKGIAVPPGASQVRIRISAYTSGTASTYMCSSNGNPALLFLAPAAPRMDQVGSIGTSSDVTFASQVLVKGMAVKNISTGGQVLYCKHSATPTSTNCLPLLPGEWSNDIECTNANQVYMRASATGGAAAYSGR